MNDVPTLAAFPGDDYSVSAVRAFDEWVGGRLDGVVTFVPAALSAERRESFAAETLTPLWNAGYTPVVTWEPFVLDERRASLTDDLRRDNLLRGWAETLAAWVANSGGEQRTFVFRPAHEMNGSWYPWSAGAGVSGAEYVEFWNALAAAFDARGPPSDAVTWLWCPNANSDADVALADYYPGDAAVDVVGVDGYNWGTSQPWSRWRTPAEVFAGAFERVRALSERPLVVPEVGCSSAYRGQRAVDRKSAWITDAFDLFSSADVALAGWFNVNKETDWAVCTRDLGANAPATRSLNGADYGVYPAFERAADAFIDYNGNRP